MNKYEVVGVVGEGAYGVVLKCRNKETGDVVAVKKFKESDDDEAVKKTTLREVKVLRSLEHENVVSLKEAFRRKGKLYLVFEYVEKNLLEVLEERPGGLSPDTTRRYVWQLARAVAHCHRLGIVHRDIKPENLLVNPRSDRANALKLCDFGFARPLRAKAGRAASPLTDYVATRWYRAPELLLGSTSYGFEVDAWAIGCIMGELIDGQPLFPGESDVDQLYVIQKAMGGLTKSQTSDFLRNKRFAGLKFPDMSTPDGIERRYAGKCSNKGMAFMKATLAMDPKERLTWHGMLTHPYFQGCEGFDPDLPKQKPAAAAAAAIATERPSGAGKHGRGAGGKKPHVTSSAAAAAAAVVSPLERARLAKIAMEEEEEKRRRRARENAARLQREREKEEKEAIARENEARRAREKAREDLEKEARRARERREREARERAERERAEREEREFKAAEAREAARALEREERAAAAREAVALSERYNNTNTESGVASASYVSAAPNHGARTSEGGSRGRVGPGATRRGAGSPELDNAPSLPRIHDRRAGAPAPGGARRASQQQDLLLQAYGGGVTGARLGGGHSERHSETSVRGAGAARHAPADMMASGRRIDPTPSYRIGGISIRHPGGAGVGSSSSGSSVYAERPSQKLPPPRRAGALPDLANGRPSNHSRLPAINGATTRHRDRDRGGGDASSGTGGFDKSKYAVQAIPSFDGGRRRGVAPGFSFGGGGGDRDPFGATSPMRDATDKMAGLGVQGVGGRAGGRRVGGGGGGTWR